MTTLANAIIKLVADTFGFDAAMKQSITEAQKMGKGWESTGKQMTSVGMGLTAGVTAPLVAAGWASTMMASDFQETASKVGVVFGSMSDEVMAWSENASSAMVMSQEEALGAAGTYGNLMVSMGMTEGQAADMSMGLVQLGADLSSFNNIDPAEALDKLRAGLTGESEPLKTLGVNINELLLKERALEMGLWDGEGALSAAAKAQAAYALIMEQTTTAQGDVERTSDNAANQMREFVASMKDVGRMFGTHILPFLTQAMQFINDLMVKFSGLSGEQQKAILIVAGIAAAVGPVLIVVGSVVGAIGTLIPVFTAIGGAIAAVTLPIWGIAAAVIAVVALIAIAWTQNWGGIQEKTAAFWAWLQSAIDNARVFIMAFFNGDLGLISELWANTWDSIVAIFSTWWENIKLVFEIFKAVFEGDWRRVGELLREIWDNTWEMLKTVFGNAVENIMLVVKELPKKIWDYLKGVDWGQLGMNILRGIADGLLSGIKWIIEAAANVAAATMEAFKGFFGIQSPSKLMKVEVGYQLAAGMNEGFSDGANQLLPNTVGNIRGNLTSGWGMRGNGNRVESGVTINVNVAGGGSDYELARKIGDVVRRTLRAEGLV